MCVPGTTEGSEGSVNTQLTFTISACGLCRSCQHPTEEEAAALVNELQFTPSFAHSFHFYRKAALDQAVGQVLRVRR